MSSTSASRAAPPAGEVIPLHVSTGHMQRRFSAPALPTQEICLKADPHDSTPVRRPMEKPAEEKSPMEALSEHWASLRAQAAFNLAQPPVNAAFDEAMKLENQTLAKLPGRFTSQPVTRSLDSYIHGRRRGPPAAQRAQPARSPRVLRPSPQFDIATGWTHPHVGHVRRFKARSSTPRQAVTTTSGSPSVEVEHVPPRTAAAIARSGSPERTPRTVALEMEPSRPFPAMPGSLDAVEASLLKDVVNGREECQRCDSAFYSKRSEESDLARSAAPGAVAMQGTAPLACPGEGTSSEGVASAEDAAPLAYPAKSAPGKEVASAEDCDRDEFVAATYSAYQGFLNQRE